MSKEKSHSSSEHSSAAPWCKFAQIAFEPFHLRRIEIGRDHMGAFGVESLRRRAAYAGGRGGQQRDFALQTL
jgi:hypothetical protein